MTEIHLNLNFLKYFIGIMLFVLSHNSYSNIIKIIGAKVIDQSTTYQNEIFDLTEGYFQITNQATLKINNSKVIGKISVLNPYLFNIHNGELILNESIVNISSAVPSNPEVVSYRVINLIKGSANINHNNFDVDQSYSVGFLFSENRSFNSNVFVTNNTLNNLHGGVIFTNINNTVIANNLFSKVSSANIYFLNANHIRIENNKILFAGNNNVGDAIDMINATDFSIKNNFIASDSCYSIFILGGEEGVITQNHIVGGITYAIYINSTLGTQSYLNYLKFTDFSNLKINTNKNIFITQNYISQNRYGFTGKNIENLIVKDNIFIQRFSDNFNRKFWTDNRILLTNVANITWENNLYKEAFSQLNDNMDVESKYFVSYPLYGGVDLYGME